LIATNNVLEKIIHGVFIKGIAIIQYMESLSKVSSATVFLCYLEGI
jgi:hypothetical protein